MLKQKAKNLKELTTITLTSGTDEPSFSICPGHVTVKEFKKAAKSEGWAGGIQDIDATELRYEYWVRLKKSWRRAQPGAKDAQPVTVMDW